MKRKVDCPAKHYLQIVKLTFRSSPQAYELAQPYSSSNCSPAPESGTDLVLDRPPLTLLSHPMICWEARCPNEQALDCSVCQFPLCKYYHHIQFQDTNGWTTGWQSSWIFDKAYPPVFLQLPPIVHIFAEMSPSDLPQLSHSILPSPLLCSIFSLALLIIFTYIIDFVSLSTKRHTPERYVILSFLFTDVSPT